MTESWTRAQLKMNGKQVFRKNYWSCVGVAFLMGLIGSGSSMNTARTNMEVSENQVEYGSHAFHHGAEAVSNFNFPVTAIMLTTLLITSLIVIALAIFVGYALEIGGKRFFILNRTENPGVGTILDGFCCGHYGNIVLTLFLRELYIFLWSCLLIVPGIVKSYEYRMVGYILAENPGMDRKEAFAISKRMMDGQKMETFMLDLSFIGWYLLAAITCGIVGIFYVAPYYEATITELYAFNKIKAYNEGYIR